MKKRWEILEADEMAKDWVGKLGVPRGGVLVIGCSTSEVVGGLIGQQSSPEIAQTLGEALYTQAALGEYELVFQCCEHLNRSLVIEMELADQKKLKKVSARPVPKAGGSMATWAWDYMENPVLVESIEADGGLDIGQTLIGMHLRSVAVPIRLQYSCYGEAIITAARTRLPLIGGARATYQS